MAIRREEVIAEEWARAACSGSPLYEEGRTLVADGPELRSIWPRSEMARYLPAGRRRRAPMILLTGDRWNGRVMRTDLQTVVRIAVERAARTAGVPVVIVPFAALDSANVDRSTIRLLGSRPSETWTEERTAVDFRHVPIRERTLHRDEDRTAETLNAAVARGCPRNVYRPDPETGAYTWGEWPRDETGAYRWTVRVPYDRPKGPDGLYRWTVHRHRLGDSVFSADVVETVRRRREWTVADVIRSTLDLCYAESTDRRLQDRYYGRRGDEKPLEPATAGRRLEDLDISAPIVESVQRRRRRRFVSSFDTNEPWPAYFLATLPSSSKAETVDSALEDLAPPAVHAAILRGRDVIRQGDIFAIRTDLQDADVYAMARTRARLTLVTRSAVPKPWEPGHRAPMSKATWRKIRRDARRLFRESTADRLNLPGPTSAPSARSKARQELERYESRIEELRNLARAAVLRGKGHDARMYRDRLTHTLAYDRPAARVEMRDRYRSNGRAAWESKADTFGAAMRLYDRRPSWESIRDETRSALRVHGTTHSATEVVKGPGGTVYVRGIMRHVPELDPARAGGRDHVDVRLGTGAEWYLAVRNTVPRNRTGA